MDRRFFVAALPLAALSLVTACTAQTPKTAAPSSGGSAVTATPVKIATRAPTVTPTLTPTSPAAPVLRKFTLPHGTITGLPGTGELVAWTVDDGTDPDVVEKYALFARSTGTRLTFFLNGHNPAWTLHAGLLRPLVASGQVQLGNHTWDHQDLTRLTDTEVIDELQRNHDFIHDMYGVDARPYFRPPYGFRDARTDRLAASIGYTVPVLWYGSLSDSGLITPGQVVQFATQWFLPNHIVIGHANFEPVTKVFPQLESLITRRHLQTVTLNDVFLNH